MSKGLIGRVQRLEANNDGELSPMALAMLQGETVDGVDLRAWLLSNNGPEQAAAWGHILAAVDGRSRGLPA